MFVSDFVGYLMPGNLGVELLRVYGLARTTADTALAATSVLVERILAFFALLALVMAGLAFRPPQLPLEIMYTAWLGFVLLILAIVALMVPQLRRASLLLLPGARLARVRSVIQRIFLTLDDYKRQPWLMLYSFGLAVCFQLLRCVVAAVGAAALGVHLPFVFFVVIIPVIVLLAMLPISIAGLGVREAGYVYFFGLVGMPPEVAFSLALTIQVCVLLLTLPGAWLYMRRGVYA
jgi:uncharacterized protein (TIRG00374 family)